MKNILLSASVLIVSLGCDAVMAADAPAIPKTAQAAQAKPVRVLAFSKTNGYRHGPQIALAHAMLADMAQKGELAVDKNSGEDPAAFTDAVLKNVDVVVFLHTIDDPQHPLFDQAQRAAFESFIKRGGGCVGLHASSAVGADWPFYGEMMGAHFMTHSPIQAADLQVVNGNHPATAHLPDVFRHDDEWYVFDANIHGKPGFDELLKVDEKTYAPGAATMKDDHPIAWTHVYAGGRCFYTAIGHTEREYSRPWFRQHILGGIRWAAGRDK